MNSRPKRRDNDLENNASLNKINPRNIICFKSMNMISKRIVIMMSIHLRKINSPVV